jgi:nitroimidazol reductase NimA-like FMN-containing flavoprotein (pyridoxamine 5'-phosphate oxidase superfamily)
VVSGPATQRTTLHRYAHRAAYDRPTIDAILDQGIVSHIGLQTDKGYPVVIPLAYGRVGDDIYLHGSAASRLFRGAREPGTEICMTVTLVDGLVVARSTYNTDINYRSVMIIGHASEVKDPEERRRGLDALVNHIIPERSRDARPPTEKELRSTMLRVARAASTNGSPGMED